MFSTDEWEKDARDLESDQVGQTMERAVTTVSQLRDTKTNATIRFGKRSNTLQTVPVLSASQHVLHLQSACTLHGEI